MNGNRIVYSGTSCTLEVNFALVICSLFFALSENLYLLCFLGYVFFGCIVCLKNPYLFWKIKKNNLMTKTDTIKIALCKMG